jgi:hypothetical protein
MARNGPKYPNNWQEEQRTKSKIGTIISYFRYKSLIHKICKDDECDEIEMIKHYVRKKY